ncbi:hypothetical protein [Stenotrophomonas geniculata]|uniref:hypothetical protein n=1 Tax=Stenotrophomonas geniculata TaxID=86188 RepID=UPI00247AF534|nr:hypothetical protein [Stenotrophomonas geniculata]MDH7548243.1 hypothetical protein [Stenotrophomonas geniculata]
MAFHTAADVARNAQRNYDARLPADVEVEFQDACNALAIAYDREGDTAELIAVVAGAEHVLSFLTSAVEIPAYLLPSLRELLDRQARIVRQIEREVCAGGAA